MRTTLVFSLVAFLWTGGIASESDAQTSTGRLQFTAKITPTAARPEPVRQFTFYILTKSYADVSKEVEAGDAIPSRDQFIDDLKVSAELKKWLKAHEIMDLTMPGLDKALTPDEIINTLEFLAAYQRANSGGVTDGIPKPKYKEADKAEHPEKYAKQQQEYLAALKKFIQARPETISGMELELESVNPQRKWAQIASDHSKRVRRLAPDVAQTKYLVGKADTDLDGQAALSALPAGNYWISSLSLDVDAGDTRLRWDVPVAIQAGQLTRVELSNLNAIDARAASAP
ncbi:MAG TPA: hypothetical protein VOA64_04440 [Candidatus Dormibacteraeota bacterium]|nr:hypothetical protein [Candidatus Dormibacteraeota bacterium]